MSFLFLPLPWISKSLILVANWKMSIPLSRRTSLVHCSHWPEQPSTQSEVNCVFTVSIRDTLLASSFSLTDLICQVHGVFFHFILMQTQQCLSGQQFSARQQRSSLQLLIPFSWMNSAKSRLVKRFRLFATPQEDSPSVDFLFIAQKTRNPAINFLLFGEAAVKSPGGSFSLWVTSWSRLQTRC